MKLLLPLSAGGLQQRQDTFTEVLFYNLSIFLASCIWPIGNTLLLPLTYPYDNMMYDWNNRFLKLDGDNRHSSYFGRNYM